MPEESEPTTPEPILPGKPEELTERQIRHQEMLEMSEAALKANEEIHYAGGAPFIGHHPIDRQTGGHLGGHLGPTTVMAGGFVDHNQAPVIKNMRDADKAYREVGIIRNVVDIMTDFASEGLNIHHPIQSQERFYRAWAKKVEMGQVTKQLLQGLYKWGNIGVFKFWGKLRPKTKKEMMAKARKLFTEGRNKEALRAFFRQVITKKSRIPVRYVPIAPFRVRIHGSVLFPTRKYFYFISQLDRLKLEENHKNFEKDAKLIKEMDEEDRLQMADNGYILLPEENFEMFHYKRDASRLWADPLILPIMQDLRYKQVLRRLDISVAESIINPITIFKLGKTVEGFAPSKEMFQNLSALLKTPVQTKTLVWSDLIEVEQHFVDAKEVFTTEKFKEVDSDILAGLGVSQILINGGTTGGGSKGSFSSAFLSVRTLLERLEDGRAEIMRFLEKEIAIVASAMGWKTLPTITWDQMSLRDEESEKRIIMELLDRKVISTETALDRLGLNREIEMERKRREDKITQRIGIPHSVGPFEEAVRVQENEDPARLTIDLNKEQMEMNERMADKQLEVTKEDLADKRKIAKIPKNKDAPRPGPGRPADKGDPNSRKQKKKRNTKPVGMGQTIDPLALERVNFNRNVIEKWFKERYLKAASKNNLRQLTISEKTIYNDCILAILTQTTPEQVVTTDWLDNNSEEILNNLKTNAEIGKLNKALIADFRKRNGREPNLSMKKELEAKAFVINYYESE